jgi:hypothetical protein
MFLRVALAAFSLPAVMATMPSVDDAHFLAEAEATLQADCGENCVKAFKNMMDWSRKAVAPGANGKVMMSDALNEMLTAAKQEGSDLAEKLSLQAVTVPTASFLTADPQAVVLEKLAEKCNFARVGALATYQAVNLAVHVVSVVGTMLCGCAAIGNGAGCAAGPYPWCVFYSNVFNQAVQQSVSAWEAVKGTTKTCAIHGDPRIAN